ncbi:hypothetical protein [Pedobacter panaciterrae]
MIKTLLIFLLALNINAVAQTAEKPLNEKPALIPMPQQIEWKKEWIALKNYKGIVVESASLQKEAELLQRQLKELGLIIPIKKVLPQINPVLFWNWERLAH